MKGDYQLGDLILIRATHLPPSARLDWSGQQTSLAADGRGQPYVLIDRTANAFIYSVQKTRFVQLNQIARIEHSDYAPICVPPGIYKVRKESQYTYAEHGQRVSRLVELLARALNLDETHIAELKFTALVHDMGAIGMEEMLWAPQRYTPEEWAIFKQHPIRGAELVGSLRGRIPEATDRVCDYVRHHHEHFDGSGYPNAFVGEEIPLGSRILLIAEAYEAMTSRRPHRAPMLPHEAVDELYTSAGKRFDPYLLNVFVDALDDQV